MASLDAARTPNLDHLAKNLLPSFSFANRTLSVGVYTIADRLKVELNGHVVQDKALTPLTSRITQIVVPYMPGRLVVTAFIDGRQIGRRPLEIVGPPEALRINADRTRIGANRHDLSFATIEIVDG
ncbi:hypothetical protein [Parafrankia sp. BMG5.11]|uniref:hypothetical protein n=1 Tax=Parafrankia sp. BMG5.11 TaxID=222540 RepID=UPI001040B15D|nr:hypothetical protein [Parafrankia sp. BMG5.11]TCJ37078.1 hypothetical protein E0504_18485 [Parafrankia sp. BMG5.11]